MSVTIPFVREMAFAYGAIEQVSPGIRRIVANNPGPFTFYGTGVYVVGQGEVAVIDPGPLDAEHIAALQAALAGERVTHILLTHGHLDHSPAAAPLAAATGAPILGRPMVHRHGHAAVRVDEDEDDSFRVDTPIHDGDRIAGPGWTLEAILTPGHTSNHVCYALLEENALFSGDHVMGWSTTVVSPPDGDMAAYMDSLRRVQGRGFATIWPTHGPPIREPAPFLQAYLDHRLAREAQILAQIAAGRVTIPDMVAVMYAAVDPRLHPAARHSVLAHLIKLAHEGRVRCEGEPAIDSVYALA
jgi:glyoxylase-like metal-dependent hydrolase (beta-lactamase superfamily II)